MQTERTFIDDLKYQYTHGGMTVRLIIVNAAVFLVIQIATVFGRLLGPETSLAVREFLDLIFTLDVNAETFFLHPWGIFTSIFAHYGLIHFLMNMLFLYFSGKMFESVFDHRRLWYTYLFGGLLGGVIEILAHLLPALQNDTIPVVGASGSIMAIFAAMAFYRPHLKVMLFGVFPVRLIILAAFFILADLLALGLNDGTAHFAHIGGVILGALSVQNVYSRSNIIVRLQSIGDKLNQFFRTIFSSKPKMKVKKGGRTASFKSDEQYNMDAKARQQRTDAILDKISRSGYESLTKEEKDFLFNQSKNG